MCGLIKLGDRLFEIYCEVLDPFWWRDPGPLIDFSRFSFGDEIRGGATEVWKGELSKISDILAAAGKFQDPEVANQLGRAAAKAGTMVAELAKVDVQFEWTEHEMVR